MSLTVKDITKIIENFAPKELKEDYDNVGLMVGDMSDKVKSILVSLDTTMEVIEEAVQKQCNLIISHHPLLFRKPSSITTDTLMGRKILKAVKNNINIYACHTNLDVAECGMNDALVSILGFTESVVMEKSSKSNAGENTGIGRLVTLKNEVLLSDICEKIKAALKLNYLRFSGEPQWPVRKIAVINGSGQDYFNLAKRLGADCILSGDTTYHYVSDFYEEKIAVIDAGHHGTEWPAMKAFASKLASILKGKDINIPILVSEKNYDPYKVL